MNTDRLVEFQVLAQTRHYGQAAQQLYMSQPALSRHIQELERELGARLFHRGPHGVTLTAAGSFLYRESLSFLRQADKAADRVNSAGMDFAGSVRFACLRAADCAAVQRFLAYFEHNYPNILLTPEVMSDVPKSAEVSNIHYLAMPTAAVVPHHFRLMKTLHEKGALVLPPEKKRMPDGVMSLTELAGETLFLPGYSAVLGSYARIWQLTERVAGGRCRIVRVRNPETALMNVAMGRGYTILPYHRVDEVNRGQQYAAVAEPECFFELLFYQNEAITDDPAALLFGKEFCDMVQL